MHGGWGEFLYDVIWLQTVHDRHDRNRLAHVPLVAEIEWAGREDVWYDFQELLIARADVRLMICNEHPDPSLVEVLRTHTVRVGCNGDQYIVAQYRTRENRFIVEAWTVRL